MIPYLVVFILSAFCSFAAYNVQKARPVFWTLIVISVLLPALLSGYRDMTVGIDVLLYGVSAFNDTYWIETFRDLWVREDDVRMEVGYVAFNWIIRHSTEDIFWFFFWQQFFALSIVQIACWRMQDKLNAPLLYTLYLVYYYCISMCHLRQMFAVAIVVLAYSFAIDRQWLKFGICLLLAMIFHRSAVFVGIVYLAHFVISDEEPVNPKYLLALLIGGTIFVVLFPPLMYLAIDYGLMDAKYAKYAEDVGNRVHKADLLITGVMYLFYRIDKDNYHYANSIRIFSLMALFILACGMYNDVAQRIAYYLNIYLFVNILCLAHKPERLRLSYAELMLSAMLTVQFVYIGLRFRFAEVIPYTSSTLGIG